MKRGRALLPHPAPRQDDTGRWFVSRQSVAYLAHRHIDYVRKLVPAVACDVATRVLLLDLEEAERVLGGRPFSGRTLREPLASE